MINVLHISDKLSVGNASFHGVTRLFSWLIPRFDKGRFRVSVCSLRRRDTGGEYLEELGIKVHYLARGKFNPLTIIDLLNLCRQENIDILHLHGYGASNFGGVAAWMRGVKMIVHEHFVDPAMPKYQIPVDYTLSRFADMGIAVSKSVKDFMVHERFFPEGIVKVIFNGVPLREFKPVHSNMVAAERQKWNVPDSYRIVATIGRLDEQKGNQYFVDAAAILLRKGYKIKFMLVGDGPLKSQLQAQCNICAIEEDVIFAGYYTNIPLIQSLIDVQVFPSLWEGTPLTVFEAMSMKSAIVSTFVDGLGEVLKHGESALLVPPRNAQALAEAIEALVTDPEKAERLATRAELDSRTFDIGNTVGQIQQIYDEVMSLV